MARAVAIALFVLPYVGAVWPASQSGSHGRRFSGGRGTFPKLLARNDAEDDANLWSFKSRPDIRPPKWEIETFDKDALAPGYWFVAPYAKLKQIEYPLWNGPHIFDGNGDLIWSGVSMFNHSNVYDFRTYMVHDEPKLTLIFPGEPRDAGVVLNKHYEIESTVDMGGFGEKNMHDFVIIDNGRRALTLDARPGNSSKAESLAVDFNGECCARWEGFKELNLETSSVVYDWDPHGRIGLDESTKIRASYEEMCTECWDILHLNSIDKFPDGDYLVSSRHADTIYKISHETKSIVWRLGGVRSDFEIEPAARFTRQHHARVHGQNQSHILLSLFNNAIGNGEGEQKSSEMSSGLYLSLNTETMKADLLRHYDHPEQKNAVSRGSLEFLPNGNAFLGWTIRTLISEHSDNGTLLMKARLAEKGANNYRAFKLPWVGQPLTPPDVCVSKEDISSPGAGHRKRLDVYVSWNGATEVATWKLYRTNAKGSNRKPIASTARQGFESKLEYDGDAKFVIVEALDADGRSIGTSAITEAFGTFPAQGGGWAVFGALVLSGIVICFTVIGLVSAWFKRHNSSWLLDLLKRNATRGSKAVGGEEEWIETHLLESEMSDNEHGEDVR